MKIRNLIVFIFASFILYPAHALLMDEITPLERQQISVPTPGLFEKSKAFTVDFSILKADEWTFPLPVGVVRKSTPKFVDIYTVKGDAVKAMFAGTVRLARNHASYGNVVVLRHDNGLETVYGNNAQNLVKVGDRVKSGQTIAIVGTDAAQPDSARCRLEVMVNGCPINAETLFKLQSHALRRHVFLFTSAGRSVDVRMIDAEADEEKAPYVENPVIEMDGEFTASEQRIVSAPTRGLFEKNNSITIDFSTYSDAYWHYPLEGAKVISPYGGKRRHSGVDLKTKPNDSIRVVFDGCVRFSSRYSGYGNVIVVRHANGTETLYSHNSKNLVAVGDWVKAGQVIALTGRTGRASTEHLHFEVRINGKAYNPDVFFDCQKRALRKVKVVAHKSGRLTVTKTGDKAGNCNENES